MLGRAWTGGVEPRGVEPGGCAASCARRPVRRHLRAEAEPERQDEREHEERKGAEGHGEQREVALGEVVAAVSSSDPTD